MNLKARTLLEAFAGLPRGAVVVEIGCVRFASEVASDGYSTVHLARAASEHGWELYSVDSDPDAVDCASTATRGLPLTVICKDGEAWLSSFDRAIDGLYLDGSANPQETVTQYLKARLADRCVVLIDDVQDITWIGGAMIEQGKGSLLLERLDADGFDVQIHDTEPGYRMAVATR